MNFKFVTTILLSDSRSIRWFAKFCDCFLLQNDTKKPFILFNVLLGQRTTSGNLTKDIENAERKTFNKNIPPQSDLVSLFPSDSIFQPKKQRDQIENLLEKLSRILPNAAELTVSGTCLPTHDKRIFGDGYRRKNRNYQKRTVAWKVRRKNDWIRNIFQNNLHKKPYCKQQAASVNRNVQPIRNSRGGSCPDRK